MGFVGIIYNLERNNFSMKVKGQVIFEGKDIEKIGYRKYVFFGN